MSDLIFSSIGVNYYPRLGWFEDDSRRNFKELGYIQKVNFV